MGPSAPDVRSGYAPAMIDLDMMTYPRQLPWVQELARKAEAAGIGGLWFTDAGGEGRAS